MTAADLLARPAPGGIHVHGPRPLAARRAGQAWKALVSKGLLSGLLLLMALPNAHAGGGDPAASRILDAPPAARQPALAPARLFVPMAHLPSADGLVNANGTIDGIKAIEGWHAAGISMPRIHRLAQLMVATQSPVLARSQEDLDQAKELSQTTAGMFDLTGDAQAKDFLRARGMPALAQAGWMTVETVQANLRGFADPGEAGLDDVRDYWLQSSMLTTGGPCAPLAARDRALGMDAAVARLRTAMDEAGLDSLQVPVSMWSSPETIAAAASGLAGANRELQGLTGWTGPVLGLGGRIDMTLGSAHNVGLTQATADGWLHVQARFSDLAHEWIHAVDIAVAVDIGRLDEDHLPRMLSWGVPDRPVVESWQSTYRDLEVASRARPDSWFARMDRLAADIEEGRLPAPDGAPAYLRSSHERQAYGFASFAASQLPSGAVLAHPDNTTPGRFAHGPSLAESGAQSDTWRRLFQSVGRQWWAPPDPQGLVAAAPPRLASPGPGR